MVDHESILIGIKKLLNIAETDTAFDPDIIMLINSEFMTLRQLGIGPESGFSIEGPDETWIDFCSNSRLNEAIRSFVYMRVRMVFDPPASSVVADAINSRISELEWRLNHQAEMDAKETTS